MSATPVFQPTNQLEWINRHHTFKQEIDNLFDAINSRTGEDIDDYNKMTVAIQEMMGKAIQKNKKMKVLGGGWSLSKVATTNGWMIDSKQMNLIFNVNARNFSDEYKGDSKMVLFAQCGNSIKEINDILRNSNRSLKTCGASNGQTIAGAISTGTHGAAIDVGSTPEFVIGLHIVTSANEHVWLERSSYPVASKIFTDRINAKPISSDELFYSALVSFGSFGFIHGVMIESEPLYLLETFRKQVPLADLTTLADTLDFSNSNFDPYPGIRPFHFQWVINPHNVDAGAFVTLMYKKPFKEPYDPPVRDPDKAGPGDDAPMFIGKATDLFPALTSTIVNLLFKSQYKTFDGITGTCGEIFYNTDTRGKVASSAIAIPIEFVSEINELLLALNKQSSFIGIFSYRYVKGTKATLGFTSFENSCVVELDAADSASTQTFYKMFWEELNASNIPYTFHWGKMNNIDADLVKKMYGPKRDTWLNARKTLLPPTSIELFNNQLLVDWGLDCQ